jgi:hypothetical protein
VADDIVDTPSSGTSSTVSIGLGETTLTGVAVPILLETKLYDWFEPRVGVDMFSVMSEEDCVGV